MRKKLLEFLALSLAFVLCVPTAGAARRGEEMVRVGLAYGSGALVGANLENNTGYGSGYRFGYFDEDLRFEELGETDEKETQITVLKAQNTWFYYDRSSGKYYLLQLGQRGHCGGLLPPAHRTPSGALTTRRRRQRSTTAVSWPGSTGTIRCGWGPTPSKEDAGRRP